MAKRKSKKPNKLPEDQPNNQPACMIVKMVSGETILAELLEVDKGSSYRLSYPMKLVFTRMKQGKKLIDVFGFTKWIENTPQSVFVVEKSKILAIAKPDDFTIDRYQFVKEREQMMVGEDALLDTVEEIVAEQSEKVDPKKSKNKPKQITEEQFRKMLDEVTENGQHIDEDPIDDDEDVDGDAQQNDSIDDWDPDGPPTDHKSRFSF